MLRAIRLIQNAEREIEVKDDWPQRTMIAHVLCYQPVKIFDSGSADYIFTIDGDNISVNVKNGAAKYKIESFTSDAAYVCDLVEGYVGNA